MQELIDMFVQGLPDYLSRLQQAEAEQDLSALQDLAHQLKGSAASFGFPQITDKAKVLEKALKTRQAYQTLLMNLLTTMQQTLNPDSL
jgi:HPt (histidine-containing phosphotransfer) domain-containing protein